MNRARMPVVICLFVSLFARCPRLFADSTVNDAGTSSAQFLKLGAGARAEGLGGAYGAVSEDATAVYWNPAGLALLKSQSATFMHAAYVESIFYDFVSYATPFGKNAGFGTSIQYLSFGQIDETDDTGLQVGTYRPENLALNFGGGFRLGRLSSGLSLKYIRSKIRDTASTATSDVGFLYHFRVFALGLGAQNIFSRLTFDRQPSQLPLNYKVSGAFRPTRKFLATMDLNMPRDNQPELSAGVERLFDLSGVWTISPRVGYTSRTRDLSGNRGVTAGFGVAFQTIAIDYAWVPSGELGQTHKISLTAFWGKKRNKR